MWVIFLFHLNLCCYVAPLLNVKVCYFLCLCRDKCSHFTSTKVLPCCVILNSCIPICTAVCHSSLTLITKTLCDQHLCSFSQNLFTSPVSITVPFPSMNPTSQHFSSTFPVRSPVLKHLYHKRFLEDKFIRCIKVISYFAKLSLPQKNEKYDSKFQLHNI